MQLNDLRTHPIIKPFVYAVFWLIIISFIFFYGWNSGNSRANAAQNTFARYRSDDPLGFLPWRKYDTINAAEVRRGRELVVNKKLSFVPQQLVQYLLQQRQGLQWLATQEEAIQQAMDLKLLLMEAKRLGIVVPTAEIQQNITNQFKTYDQFEAMLKSNGMTYEEYVNEIRQEQMALRAERFVESEAHVSLYELWQEYTLANEKMQLKIAAFPVDKYAEQVQVSDEDMQKYLAGHQEEFRVPAKRRYEYVKLTRDELKAKVETTPAIIQSFYEQNQALFSKPDAVRVEDVFVPLAADQPTSPALHLLTSFRDQATSGASWLDLAAKIEKENAGSTIYRQDLGWIERSAAAEKSHGKEFVDRAFTLAVDQISTPVMGTNGMYLLRPLEKRPAGVPPLAEIQAQVEEKYREDKANTMFKDEFARLREELKRYNSLREFATATNMKDEMTTMTLANAFVIPEIGSLSDHRSYLANLSVNQISQFMPVPNNNPTMITAVQVVQEVPAYVPELPEVRTTIEGIIKKDKAREVARAAAEKAYQDIKTGEDFDKIAAAAPQPPVDTEPFKRTDPVTALGFPFIDFKEQTFRLAQGSLGMSAYGQRKESADGFAIWKVLSITSPSRDEFKAERRNFEQDFLHLLRLTTMEEWLADKRKEIGFEILIKDRETAEAAETAETAAE